MPKVFTLKVPDDVLPGDIMGITIKEKKYYIPCPNRLFNNRLIRVDVDVVEAGTLREPFHHYGKFTVADGERGGSLIKCMRNGKRFYVLCPLDAVPGDTYVYKLPQCIIDAEDFQDSRICQG
jgi:hypothetical protein